MEFLNENDDKNDTFLEVKKDANNNINKKSNIKYDEKLIKLQENLLLMGFDIDMINQVIMHFNITNENEAIDYLIKSDDGKWHHPFVKLKEENSNQNEEILNNNFMSIDNVINHVKTINNNLKLSKEICQICGESKETHIEIQNENDNKYDEDIYDLNNNNILNNFENIDNNIENNNICKICLEEIENPIELEKCKHRFCRECFQEYLNNLINQNNIDKIPCPEVKCTNKSLNFDFFSQYLVEEQLIKYNQLKTRNEIARDKLKIFCPICDSYAKIDNPDKYNPNNKSYVKSTLICQKGHEFCSCGRPQHNDECYHDGEEFNNLIIKEKIKKCPKCGFLIKKNSGCNHMTCGNKTCKYEFCWLCLQESLPDHYESGPCSGMQFVDPDSFIYQLEQRFPILYYIFNFFKVLLITIFIFLSLIFPVLLLWPLTGFILYDNFISEEDDVDKLYTLPKYSSLTHFIICIPILLSIQSLYYMTLAIIIIYFTLHIIYLLLCLICYWLS